MKWVKSKGAILVVIWTFLSTTVFHFLRDINGHTGNPTGSTVHVSPGAIILVLSAILYPIGGWVADTYVGRYKMIRSCVWIMWVGAIFITIGEIVADVNTTYDKSIREYVIYIMGVIMAIGLGGFQSNIIQLGTDQLTDASSTEITSFITLYVLAIYASGVTLQHSTTCISYTVDGFSYIKSLAVALCLSIVLCTDFLLQHWLIKGKATVNSIGLILGVIKYIIKNRKHRYMFAIDDEMPSCFDVAKYRYGGSFTSQQVEDVKSFLQMVIVIATCTIVFGDINIVEYAKETIAGHFIWQGNSISTICYERLTMRYSGYLFVIVLVLLYELVIYPLLGRYLPRWNITTRFLLGVAFFLLWVMSLLGIEIAAFTTSSNTTSSCVFIDSAEIIQFSPKWLLVPGFLSGVSTFLTIHSGIEFVWAQTPYFMTGLVFGLTYAFLGLYTFIHVIIASPFYYFEKDPGKYAPLNCGIWYFILQSVIVSGVLAGGVIVFKIYKRRNRNVA